MATQRVRIAKGKHLKKPVVKTNRLLSNDLATSNRHPQRTPQRQASGRVVFRSQVKLKPETHLQRRRRILFALSIIIPAFAYFLGFTSLATESEPSQQQSVTPLSGESNTESPTSVDCVNPELTEAALVEDKAVWIEYGGVRAAEISLDCRSQAADWSVTQSLQDGKWVTEKVARKP